MPPDAPQAGSAQDWLRHARSDLALASMRKTKRVLYEHLCFHAQQAVEKAVIDVLNKGYRTYDIMDEDMKKVGTREMGELVAGKV